MGVSYDLFMDLCPNELKAFENSKVIKIKELDQLVHVFGIYVESAVSVAVDRCLSGKKSKAKYIETPLLDNLGLTEDEILDKEIKKAIQAEEQWIVASRKKGLPETKIK